MNKTVNQQRGVSLSGLLVVLGVFAMIAIFAMKLIPSYMENGKIQSAFNKIANDPSMRTASAIEIKESFYKQAVVMDNVSRITTEDIVIDKDNGNLTISASYTVKVPLAGNVSLLIDFNPMAPQ